MPLERGSGKARLVWVGAEVDPVGGRPQLQLREVIFRLDRINFAKLATVVVSIRWSSLVCVRVCRVLVNALTLACENAN